MMSLFSMMMTVTVVALVVSTTMNQTTTSNVVLAFTSTPSKFMRERARMVKTNDFASSLKSTSAEPRLVLSNNMAATTTSWTTQNGKPISLWGTTTTTTPNSYWTTSSGKPMATWGNNTNPAFTPATVKSVQQSTTGRVTPIMSYADTLKAMTSETIDQSKMSLPYGTAYRPVVVKPGVMVEVASPGASRHLNQYDARVAYFSATTTVAPNKVSKYDESPHPDGVFEFKSSMKRAIFDQEGKPVTYVVEGYRFKPETKSLIHPDGVFKFETETRKIVKLSDREVTSKSQTQQQQPPKGKPINYPVAGFRFDDNTKTVIQKEKVRNGNLASPISPTHPETVSASIVTPNNTTPNVVVNVMSDGASMNTAAVSSAYKEMGSSYLDALNRGGETRPSMQSSDRQQAFSTSDDDELIVKPMATFARTGLSYLETLGR